MEYWSIITILLLACNFIYQFADNMLYRFVGIVNSARNKGSICHFENKNTRAKTTVNDELGYKPSDS